MFLLISTKLDREKAVKLTGEFTPSYIEVTPVDGLLNLLAIGLSYYRVTEVSHN